MTNRRTSVKLVSAFLGLSLLVAACGDDDDGDAGGGTGTEETTTTAAGEGEGAAGGTLTLGAEQFPECLNPITQCANSSWMHWAVDMYVLPKLMTLSPEGDYIPSPVLDGEPVLAGEGVDDSGDPFTVTYTFREEAVWDDGTPISCADVEFTRQARLQTTGTLTTVGYEDIESVEEGSSPTECVITFARPVAAWADLFGSSSEYILKADAFAGPDIANDLNNEIPFSGGPYILDEFDATGGSATFSKNEAYWDDETASLIDGFTMLQQADQETEINALLAGEVAAIYPQPAPGITEQLSADNIEFQFGAGTTFEGLWFNQGSLLNPQTPLASQAVREALMFAVDREEILAEVITPNFPETEILNCGGWVPTVGDWCDNTDFEDVTFDPDRVAELLEGDGWTLGGDGIYEKGGQRLSMTWQTVAGNARREQIQSIVIPALAELGIELTADNSDADTLFQVRLPQLDTEVMLYAQVASPDPSVTTIYHCDNIPSAENEFAGQNNLSWCNEEASALMNEADQTPEPEARLEITQQIGDFVRQDAVWLPFYQLPLITAWDTTQVAGPVGLYTSSPLSGFYNIYDWSVAS